MVDQVLPDAPDHHKSFEALGRYVQGFEYMVSEARLGIIQTATNLTDTALVLDVILNHHAFSAQPLFDVFRATANMFASRWQAASSEDREFAGVILTDIHKRASVAIKLRNNILHGMHIDISAKANADFSRLNIWKRKVGKAGLMPAEVPRDRRELQQLTSECYDIRDLTAGMKGWMIQMVLTSVTYRKPDAFFAKEAGRWSSLVRYERDGDRSSTIDVPD